MGKVMKHTLPDPVPCSRCGRPSILATQGGLCLHCGPRTPGDTGPEYEWHVHGDGMVVADRIDEVGVLVEQALERGEVEVHVHRETKGSGSRGLGCLTADACARRNR